MALSLYEAAKLSRNPLARGVMLGVATSDELISQLPMMPVAGEATMYNREKSLPTAEFVAPDHASLTESSATFDRVLVPLRLLVTDLDVYDFVEEQMADTNAQRASQLAQKLKAVGRKIADKLITGGFVTSATISEATTSPGLAIDAVVAGPHHDSDRHGPGSIRYTHAGTLWAYRAPGDRTYGANVAAAADGTITLLSDNPNRWIQITLDVSDATADGEVHIRFASTTNEPDGLNKLISSGQEIAATGAAGDALTFDVLDQLIDEKVKVRERLCFVMNSKLKRKFYGLARALGGAGIETVNLPGVTAPVPAYRGIPILQNDWITSAESKGGATTLSSVYLISLGEEGFHARVGMGGTAMNVDADPRAARIMGLRIRDVGDLEGKEAKRTRVSWYGTFALGADLAAARAKNLITA